MSAIGKHLKPAQLAKIKLTTQIINELYGLPDVELGRQLLDLAQEAWQDFERQPWRDQQQIDLYRKTYTGGFIHEFIPEIAKRLGCQDVTATADIRRPIARLQSASPAEFRQIAGNIIKNTSDNAMPRSRTETPTAFEILTHDIANGNPVAFAVDRIARPSEFVQYDWMAGYVRGVSLARGLEEQLCWTPEMQNYKGLAAPEDGAQDETHSTAIGQYPAVGIEEEDEHQTHAIG